MEPEVRNALVGVGIVFCIFFGGLTIGAILDQGFDMLSVLSLAIIALIATGLIGAILNPPED